MKSDSVQPRVAITILIWNGKEDTLKCLRSLREDTYVNKEIIIVDNGSTDDSVEEIRRSFPEVIVLVSPSLALLPPACMAAHPS